MSAPKYPRVRVSLSGEDGNAFFIISRTMMALKKAGVSAEEAEQYRVEAESGDYDNVIQTTMKWVSVS